MKDIKNIIINSKEKNKRIQEVKEPILAVDYGIKFCGLAFSPDGICIFPIDTIKHDEAAGAIIKNTENRNIKKIIFGLPLSSEGIENKICEDVRSFAKNLSKILPKIISIEFVDERFSTQNVIKPKKIKPKGRIDDLAAMQILEFYLQKNTVFSTK